MSDQCNCDRCEAMMWAYYWMNRLALRCDKCGAGWRWSIDLQEWRRDESKRKSEGEG